MATVLCYGDSNTWGSNPDPTATGSSMRLKGRWPKVLQNLRPDLDIVEAGLSGRTTLYDDPSGPSFADYCCNGRKSLKPILHSAKPLDYVILALGCNDLKDLFYVNDSSIVENIMVLVRDVQKAENIGSPAIIVLPPAVVKITESAKHWGFGSGARGKQILDLLRTHLPQVNATLCDTMPDVGEDGVHFDSDGHQSIAIAVAKLIRGSHPSSTIAVPKIITGEAPPARKRVGQCIKLRRDQFSQYTKLHDNPWPQIVKCLYECNIRNFVIYYCKQADILFSHFEYVGEDFERDMALIAADPVTTEWWKCCEPCQEPFDMSAMEMPPSAGGTEWWTTMEELFHGGGWPVSWSAEYPDPNFVPKNREEA